MRPQWVTYLTYYKCVWRTPGLLNTTYVEGMLKTKEYRCTGLYFLLAILGWVSALESSLDEGEQESCLYYTARTSLVSPWSVMITLYIHHSAHCTLCSIHCTVYTVQYILYTVHCIVQCKGGRDVYRSQQQNCSSSSWASLLTTCLLLPSSNIGDGQKYTKYRCIYTYLKKIIILVIIGY